MKVCDLFSVSGIGEFYVEKDDSLLRNGSEDCIDQEDGTTTIRTGNLLIRFTPETWSLRHHDTKPIPAA